MAPKVAVPTVNVPGLLPGETIPLALRLLIVPVPLILPAAPTLTFALAKLAFTATLPALALMVPV